jgi:lipopolysaccharide transport system ATP-binding protein
MRYLNRFRMQGTLLFVSHDGGAVVKLCDRALWLDQGEVRGYGDAKEMCRLYLAAQAEEGADDGAGFRLGGRSRTLRSASVDVSPGVGRPQDDRDEDRPIDAFHFDADEPPNEEGEATIESVGVHDMDGNQLRVAGGGELVELRIVCRADRPLRRPVVAYAVRDRLGQILFSDDTYAAVSSKEIVQGQPFYAAFEFFLPYLASGAYAIETFLFDLGPNGPALRRRGGGEFLQIQSHHISNGLANVGMRAVSLSRIVGQSPRSADDGGKGIVSPELAAETLRQ